MIKLLLICKASVFMMVTESAPKSDAEVHVVHRHVGLLQDVSVDPVLVDGPDSWYV